jgi:hypothetical protein
MHKKRTTLQTFLKPMFAILVIGGLLAACAPAQSPEQIQAQIQTGVAMTMQSQNQMGTAVAMTVESQSVQPVGTATSSPTEASVVIPTLTPIISTPTTFVATPVASTGGSGGSGGSSSKPSYDCDPDIGKRPFDNSSFARGDKFDVKWTILNTGTATWAAGIDLTYFSGPQMTSITFEQLPTAVKPGDSYSVVLDAVAPSTPGHYVMTWKLEGGFCWPYIAIDVK